MTRSPNFTGPPAVTLAYAPAQAHRPPIDKSSRFTLAMVRKVDRSGARSAWASVVITHRMVGRSTWAVAWERSTGVYGPPVPSGRPEDGEFADYAKADIDLVAGDDAAAALRAQLAETLALLSPLEEDFAGTHTYAPGKWTLKQIVGHLADDERIFTDCALRVARGDETPQPGFDEKRYVENAGFERRSFADLLAEYRAVREAAMRLFSTFTREAWLRRGDVNGYAASTRGLVFHIAGHELHHLRIVRERYLG